MVTTWKNGKVYIDYNQNDVAKFVPLYQHTQGGEKRAVIMEAKGQEQGVVLCDLGNKFVTWSIYRHDNWAYTNGGNYYTYDKDDKPEEFKRAKANFFKRVEEI